MVYRIHPRRNSRLAFFLRNFLPLLCLVLACALTLSFLIGWPQTAGEYAQFIILPGGGCALIAALLLRFWQRKGWFAPQPPAYFLTLVEEGLLVETPARGEAAFFPWPGLRFRCQGDMLQLFFAGALVGLLSLSGVARARRKAILARLHEQQRLALATPKLPPLLPREGLPALPRPTLPPPASEPGACSLIFSNSEAQWKACLHLAQRPGRLVCGVLLLAVVILGYQAGACGAGLPGGLLLALALCLLGKMLWPGLRSNRRVPGPMHYTLGRHECCEQLGQGVWCRWRVPAAEGARMVRLPQSYCLLQDQSFSFHMFDRVDELPPALAALPQVTAPSKRPRAALGCALLTASVALGYLVGYEPPAEQLAFRALLPEPAAADLRAFAQQFYANGQVLDTPQLFPCEWEGEELYMLTFTDSASKAGADERFFCLAWEACITLYPSGRLHEKDGWRPSWDCCEEWMRYLNNEDAEEPWSQP